MQVAQEQSLHTQEVHGSSPQCWQLQVLWLHVAQLQSVHSHIAQLSEQFAHEQMEHSS